MEGVPSSSADFQVPSQGSVDLYVPGARTIGLEPGVFFTLYLFPTMADDIHGLHD